MCGVPYLVEVQYLEGYPIESLDLVELALLMDFQLLKLLVALHVVLGKGSGMRRGGMATR
jgi:hypothetical protein